MKTLSQLAILFLGIFLISCDGIFQFNPNQIVLKDNEKDLTVKNIEKIKQLPVKDTLRFILMGDSQRWYDETSDFVKSANKQKDISFVLHAGDISDFGITREFEWVNAIMQKLNYPYLTVIGNHDIVANGPDTYTRMYGALDYSFEFGQHKFIFVNTNSREYAFDGTTPNLAWLRSELANNPGKKNTIVVAHVPPFDADFNPKLEKEYVRILAESGTVKMSLYGHQHTFKDGVHYYVTTSMGTRGYMIVNVWKDGYKVDRVEF
ncbi:metallophosphoesterase [Dyadobacter sp. LHD-138]|uniref:metallophosphoesterase family protein n=1 Tax=Dyadobacter sp. LHD-138 TaxID=3071413 RepID=UPI0027E06583|nr:metallophosphoesterase [Dyadobacter sp. LHD-138]MDQ6479334.1 metallophosphoesterase [Dyadobacter sp. LHD-138]